MFGNTAVFDEYLEAFCKLADSEGLEYNRKKLARTLSRYPCPISNESTTHACGSALQICSRQSDIKKEV